MLTLTLTLAPPAFGWLELLFVLFVVSVMAAAVKAALALERRDRR